MNVTHIATQTPLNCDDHDLEDRDPSVVTISMYTNVMIQSKYCITSERSAQA